MTIQPVRELPVRFRDPEQIKAYGTQRAAHPVWKSTAQSYGARSPTKLEFPDKYYGNSGEFPTRLAASGMYEDRSLNIGKAD
eukprot:Clim_evm79s142 gene=Clim_evmTU79s142